MIGMAVLVRGMEVSVSVCRGEVCVASISQVAEGVIVIASGTTWSVKFALQAEAKKNSMSNMRVTCFGISVWPPFNKDDSLKNLTILSILYKDFMKVVNFKYF